MFSHVRPLPGRAGSGKSPEGPFAGGKRVVAASLSGTIVACLIQFTRRDYIAANATRRRPGGAGLAAVYSPMCSWSR